MIMNKNKFQKLLINWTDTEKKNKKLKKYFKLKITYYDIIQR